MSYISFAKQHLTRIPYGVGKYIAKIPYSYRPGMGACYKQRKSEIETFSQMNSELYRQHIFNKLKDIASYSYKNIPFYEELYKKHDVNPEKFSVFQDIFELPIISKADLQEVPLEYRSNLKIKKSLVNTGGSSGQPLGFYVEPSSVPHEWAHMHTIWGKLKYKQSDLKIVFAGRADVKNIIEYDAVRHQLTVDIYKSPELIANKLLDVFYKYRPKYLHGYPSAIFDFILWLDDNKHPLLEVFRNNIDGIFLGSEYPSPFVRDKVEKLIDCSSVSWYGHTERAILAYEKDEYYKYFPFLSYGFSEAIQLNEKEDYYLVGTSYYNLASPLIRYNTGDLIEPFFEDGFLINFKVSSGRNGEYIIDKGGNKIYLTALIFGRHHAIFDYVQHLQVKQEQKGQVTFFVTTSSSYSKDFLISKLDLSNVDLDFYLEIIPAPLKTVAGKVPLLVR
ncbi:phenylacetate--CoA ligase family protein [Acinetobacter baumannii]|uniref:hypothetical protein n=1 Tax=Acinetobacter baumannii TaxID=470 RepID=UPI0010C811BA|nr:hypothetical protein [Acinetobacter baumannii]MDC4781641.1 hypothetical protein [Acinetobacter baumannii]QCP37539.1 hypothetical protein FDM99_03010 [Acinetobacter baumannii]